MNSRYELALITRAITASSSRFIGLLLGGQSQRPSSCPRVVNRTADEAQFPQRLLNTTGARWRNSAEYSSLLCRARIQMQTVIENALSLAQKRFRAIPLNCTRSKPAVQESQLLHSLLGSSPAPSRTPITPIAITSSSVFPLGPSSASSPVPSLPWLLRLQHCGALF